MAERRKVRFRGPGSGSRRAGRAAVRAAPGQAGGERPGKGGKPARKRGPDTFVSGRPGPPDPGGGASFWTVVRSFASGHVSHLRILMRAVGL